MAGDAAPVGCPCPPHLVLCLPFVRPRLPLQRARPQQPPPRSRAAPQGRGAGASREQRYHLLTEEPAAVWAVGDGGAETLRRLFLTMAKQGSKAPGMKRCLLGSRAEQQCSKGRRGLERQTKLNLSEKCRRYERNDVFHGVQLKPGGAHLPSPWSLAARTTSTYFTSTSTVKVQNMMLKAPRVRLGSAAEAPSGKMEAKAYSGEVPMSARASREGQAGRQEGGHCGVSCFAVGTWLHCCCSMWCAVGSMS